MAGLSKLLRLVNKLDFNNDVTLSEAQRKIIEKFTKIELIFCSGPLVYLRRLRLTRASHAVEEWGDQARRRERVVMEGSLLPTTDSPCIGIVE
ncbi:hypothetical protein J6590_086570 [Homalodisca vitripennis]|nr:hypothetical protein J6590_086570 [Homalodisca vitripennis]